MPPIPIFCKMYHDIKRNKCIDILKKYEECIIKNDAKECDRLLKFLLECKNDKMIKINDIK